MILLRWRKSIKYFQEKTRIDKTINSNAAYQIQFYNNMKIDEYVKNWNDDEPTIKPSEAMLWAELSVLNKPEVYRNYNRIIQSPYTSNKNFQQIIIRNKANKDLNRIVEAEVERVTKNLDYVEQVLKKYDIPQKEYERLLNEQSNRSLANRQQILKEVAVKQNELLVSEGLNINNNVFSYRDIERTAENLLRQSQMQSQHDLINEINRNAEDEGKTKPYTQKQWIWTGRGETTRHESSNMQTRKINEPFIVINDATLEIDELMYPSDPNGSIGNTFICYCEVEYS